MKDEVLNAIQCSEPITRSNFHHNFQFYLAKLSVGV